MKSISKSKDNGNIFTGQWIQQEIQLISCCLKIEILPQPDDSSRKIDFTTQSIAVLITVDKNQLIPYFSLAIERREGYETRNITTTTEIS
jgi:hypothetical protein